MLTFEKIIVFVISGSHSWKWPTATNPLVVTSWTAWRRLNQLTSLRQTNYIATLSNCDFDLSVAIITVFSAMSNNSLPEFVWYVRYMWIYCCSKIIFFPFPTDFQNGVGVATSSCTVLWKRPSVGQYFHIKVHMTPEIGLYIFFI